MKINMIISIFLLNSIIIKAQDTIYFDEQWEVTTKNKHSFYRPLPLKKLGNVFLLRDFYKNGNLQMQGYLLDENNENSYVGDIFWYDKNGLDENMVQYYNNSSTKELIYYFNDNTIWKKITYNKHGERTKIEIFYKNKPLFSGTIEDKKQYKGVFTKSMQDNYYLDSTPEPVTTNPVSIVVPPPPMLYTQNTNEQQQTESYKAVIYWENGKKAEETIYSIDKYGAHQKLKKTNWTKDGKLISSQDFFKKNDSENYTQFTYYTANDFAKNIATEKIYQNNLLSESKSFTIDGQLASVEKYLNGELVEKNNLLTKTKSLYKDGKPWDGIFEKNLAQKLIVYELKNGIKINQEIVKNTENDKVVYKGDYKNGEPWNGSFFVTKDDNVELLQYKNGKQDGIQKIFMNYYDDLIEEYEMKNGTREGFRKQYKNDKLINESQYKNNQIVNGIISENGVKSVYNEGKLVEKIFFSDYSDEIKTKETYVNNKISTIKYYNFSIKDDEQEFYLGKYKNDLPFEGYFLNDSLISDFPLVDFYKNGQLINQYSYDFLKRTNDYQYYTFDVKSTFVNGKITDGSLFKMIKNISIIKEDYKNSQLIGFDVNLFAMHYFNRITFKSNQNEIIISELESPYFIKINNKNFSSANLFENDKLIYSNSTNPTVKEGTPNSITIFYIENNNIKKYHFSPDLILDESVYNTGLMLKIMSILPKKEESKKDYLVLLNEKMENLIQTDFDNNSNGNRLFNFPFNEEDVITFSTYNSNGKIESGLSIHEKTNKSFVIDAYSEGKKVSSEHVKSIDDILKNNKEIIRNLYDKTISY